MKFESSSIYGGSSLRKLLKDVKVVVPVKSDIWVTLTSDACMGGNCTRV